MKSKSEILVSGAPSARKSAAGQVRLVLDASEMSRVQDGDVLVTDMTDPDWEPVMKLASAIVTNRGGRTCHAAIVARELGIPAVVGCGNATSNWLRMQMVTVSCTEGDTGNIYRGLLEIEVIDLALESMPKPPVKITMNVGNPELAFGFQRIPNDGVGLARLEFIIARMIGIHPNAVLDYPDLPADLKQQVENQSAGYPDPVSFYVEKLPRVSRRWVRHSSPNRLSCACRTLNPTNTPASLADSNMSPGKKIRCWDFAALRAMWRRISATVLNLNAGR